MNSPMGTMNGGWLISVSSASWSTRVSRQTARALVLARPSAIARFNVAILRASTSPAHRLRMSAATPHQPGSTS
jgi:hypothetical protein